MTTELAQEERLARIKANAFAFLRSDWFDRLLEVYGKTAEILLQDPREIAREAGISSEAAQNFLREASALNPEQELEKAAKLGAKIIFREDETFPRRLRDIPNAPLLIYVRGEANFDLPALAIVGTRRPTHYGRKMTTRLAHDLSAAGIVITSGLARGVDTTAQDEAATAGKPTWAVLGTGLGRCYPPENARIAQKILDNGGALITEYPYDRAPFAYNFPRRNRIIAGLSDAVIVTEGTIKSGSLITAKIALEQGREVGAVPGPADAPESEGPNQLIKDGASLIRNAQDAAELLPANLLFGHLPQKTEAAEITQPLTEDEAAVVSCLGRDALPLDTIAERLGWGIPRVAGALFGLETQAVLECVEGLYARKH